MRLLGPCDRTEIDFGNQQAVRDLAQRDVAFILIRRQRLDVRPFSQIELAHALYTELNSIMMIKPSTLFADFA